MSLCYSPLVTPYEDDKLPFLYKIVLDILHVQISLVNKISTFICLYLRSIQLFDSNS
jgi:hypothetical protein